MILIDTVFINDGGGKILLDYLYDEISRSSHSRKFMFLIDSRLRAEYSSKNKENIQIVFISGFTERNRFYNRSKHSFSSVLCFANIPPNKRLKAKVYTYFHQLIYLGIPKDYSWKEKVKFKIKIAILDYFKKNTDGWIVQTGFVKKSLSKKFGISEQKIQVLPFYPPLEHTGTYHRAKHSFLYVSNANPHKNHPALVDAFCKFYDQYKTGHLTLTVSTHFPQVYNLIREKIEKGYPINNLGFIDRKNLYQYYREHEFVIYPSLSESFGLGLVEAIENGCKVLAADLPYVKAVCEPSFLFNPHETDSIFHTFVVSLTENLQNSKCFVKNNVDTVVKIISE
ncbi:MAG: glycosyltransferase [Bergeyella sp.]